MINIVKIQAFFLRIGGQNECAKNHVSLHLCLTLCDPWTVDLQALLFMGFPRREYWSGQLFPSPGDLPNPRIELASPTSPGLAGGFFTTEPLGRPTSETALALFAGRTKFFMGGNSL